MKIVARRVVALTGGSGWLGSRLRARLLNSEVVERLLLIDVRSTMFDTASSESTKRGFCRNRSFRARPSDTREIHEHIDLTMSDAAPRMAEIMRDQHVDTLIHLAMLRSPTPRTAWEHELEDVGTMHVIQACQQAGVDHLMTVTGTALYGPWPDNPSRLTEDCPLRGVPGLSFYEEKISVEQQLQRFKRSNPERRVTVLRPAWLAGPTVDTWVTRFFTRPVVPLLAGYDPLVQLLHEADLLAACMQAFERQVDGAYNLVPEQVLPASYVVRLAGGHCLPLVRALHRPLARMLWKLQVVDVPPRFEPFLRYHCLASGERAATELGFKARYTMQQAIEDMRRAR